MSARRCAWGENAPTSVRRLPRARKEAMQVLANRPMSGDPEDMIASSVRAARVIGSPAYPVSEKLLYQRIEAALERGSCPEGVARQMVAIAASGERTALLPSISCPALVIHGAADPLIPVACGIDTAALIPGARLEVIEGMGHDMPPQLIERLLALIDVHLQGKMAPQMRSQPA